MPANRIQPLSIHAFRALAATRPACLPGERSNAGERAVKPSSWFGAVSLLFALAVPAAFAAPHGHGQGVHPEDWHFTRKVAEIGHAQVIAGKLALTNAGDARVRALGKQLMQDNISSDHRLDLLALDTQIPVPSRPARAERKELDRLKLLHGAAFDQAYLAGPAVRLQRQELTYLRQEAASPTLYPGLRHFAQERLAGLEATLDAAQRLQEPGTHGRAPASTPARPAPSASH